MKLTVRRTAIWSAQAFGAILLGIGVCGAVGRRLAGRQEFTSARTRRYDLPLRRAARQRLPREWNWLLLKALVRQESNFNPRARSSAGALGLCQMLPSTAKEELRASRRDLLDPKRNIDLGARYLRRLLLDPERNIDLGARYLRRLWDSWSELPDGAPDWTRTRFALASYNAGPGRVRRAWQAAGKPRRWRQLEGRLPGETRHYVVRIMDVFLPQYQRHGHHRFTGLSAQWRMQRLDDAN